MRFYKINSDKTITIPAEGQTQQQLQYTVGSDIRKVFVGQSEQPNDKWTGMYHAGGGDPLLNITPPQHSWITISLGEVDSTDTGAPIYYQAQANDTNSQRSVQIHLQDNNYIKFTLKQDPIPYVPPEPDPDPEPEPDTHFYIYMSSPSRFDSSFTYYTVYDTSYGAGSEKYVQIYDSSQTVSTVNIELQAKRNTDIKISYGTNTQYNTSVLNYSSYMIDPVYNSSSLINQNIQNLSYGNGILSFKTSNNSDYWGDDMCKEVKTYIRLNSFEEYPTLNIKIGNALIYKYFVTWELKYSIYHEFQIQGDESTPLNMKFTLDSPVSFQISHLQEPIEAYDHFYGTIEIIIPKNKKDDRFHIDSYSVWYNSNIFNINNISLTVNKTYNEWLQHPDRLALEIVLS